MYTSLVVNNHGVAIVDLYLLSGLVIIVSISALSPFHVYCSIFHTHHPPQSQGVYTQTRSVG